MLAATHAITGAIFASQFIDPKIAILASFLSHPLLDLFPHWDFNTRWAKRTHFHTLMVSAIDALLGFSLGLIIFYQSTPLPLLMICMFTAQWADWIEAPFHFGFKFPPFTWIKKLQHYWHTKLSWPWGFIPQLAILIFAIYLSLHK